MDTYEQYRKILPTESVDYLFSNEFRQGMDKIMPNWQHGGETIEEFRQFIALKCYIKDKDATIISPSPIGKHTPNKRHKERTLKT